MPDKLTLLLIPKNNASGAGGTQGCDAWQSPERISRALLDVKHAWEA